MLGAQAQLARRAQHAVRFQPAQLGGLDDHAVGQRRAHHGDRDLEARAHVAGAADDLQAIGAVGSHLAERQLLGVRMTPRLDHLAHDDTGERRGHGRHRLDLETGQSQLLGQLRRHGERHVLLEPRVSDFHGNCFKNCKSFSKNSRRSSTP